MNRLYGSGDFSSSCSSESDDGSSTDEESFAKKRTTVKSDVNGCGGAASRKSVSQNILFKLQNREVCVCESYVGLLFDAIAFFPYNSKSQVKKSILLCKIFIGGIFSCIVSSSLENWLFYG